MQRSIKHPKLIKLCRQLAFDIFLKVMLPYRSEYSPYHRIPHRQPVRENRIKNTNSVISLLQLRVKFRATLEVEHTSPTPRINNQRKGLWKATSRATAR